MTSGNFDTYLKAAKKKEEIRATPGLQAWKLATEGMSGTVEEKFLELLSKMVQETSGVSFWYERPNQVRQEGQYIANACYETFKSTTLLGAIGRAKLWCDFWQEQANK